MAIVSSTLGFSSYSFRTKHGSNQLPCMSEPGPHLSPVGDICITSLVDRIQSLQILDTTALLLRPSLNCISTHRPTCSSAAALLRAPTRKRPLSTFIRLKHIIPNVLQGGAQLYDSGVIVERGTVYRSDTCKTCNWRTRPHASAQDIFSRGSLVLAALRGYHVEQ
jgi:hypothetical protein